MANYLRNYCCHLFLGPLTFNDGGGETLVGVVSRGYGCALKDFPGIYGRITAVLPWIKNELAETCNYIRLYPSFRINSFYLTKSLRLLVIFILIYKI